MYLTKAMVTQVETVARDCFTLCLKQEQIATVSQPGQFVHVRLSQGISPLLRRPFSIAEANPQQGTFRLLINAVGEGTRYLQGLKQGHLLDCLGPLGSGFAPGSPPYALVAGGIGAAPLVFLAQALALKNLPVLFYYGTASAEERLPLHRWLPGSVKQVDVTEDGSAGQKGWVTEALQRDVQEGKLPGGIFACGPVPMFRELVRLNSSWGIPMQVSLEERMACGTGACQGCAVEIEQESEIDFLRVCREGPVFDARKVVGLRDSANS